MNLKNKKILITGATGGIGYSLIKKFSELGSIILATGTNKDKLSKLKNEFKDIKIKDFRLDEHSKIEEFIAYESMKFSYGKKRLGNEMFFQNVDLLL